VSGVAAESRGLRLLGHTDLGGRGDASQLLRHGDYLFVGHMGSAGTSIVDVRDPERPRLIGRLQVPNLKTHAHKVQIAGNVLAVNHELLAEPTGLDLTKPMTSEAHAAGIQFFDITEPEAPKPLGYHRTGGVGVHRMWFVDGRFVYAAARPDGYRERILVIVDAGDPQKPQEVGRWWLPGLWESGGEALPPNLPEEFRYGMHHALVHGDRAYVGCLDAGIAIVDITDRAKPKTVARLSWPHSESRLSHTVLPLPNRNLLVVAEEDSLANRNRIPRRVRIVDVADESNPHEVSVFPIPPGDFPNRGRRFGPHNLHENRPGSFVSDHMVYATYFNAGVRVVDISNPRDPREVAWYVPAAREQLPCQINDVFVDSRRLVYISDREGGGVYILEHRT
jgi:hypothetical protein